MAISKFTVVAVTGTSDNKPTVEPWSPSAYEHPANTSSPKILGVTMTSSEYLEPVAVMRRGYIRDVTPASGSWSVGDLLWAQSDATVDNDRPAGPLPQVFIGTVFDSNDGSAPYVVEVNVTVIPNIGELSGVTRETPANLDTLIYSTATNAWVPRQIDHGGDIAGLLDDDHTQYLKEKGSGGLASEIPVHTHESSAEAGQLPFPKIGAATYTLVDQFLNFVGWSGSISGGAITGTTTVNVAAGTGAIRISSSNTAQLKFFDWAASNGNAIADGEVKYVGVRYNSGSPIVDVRASDNWNYYDEFPLGMVARHASVLHINTDGRVFPDQVGRLIRRFYGTLPYARDERMGGLVLGELGTRNVSLSAGRLWDRSNNFDISAIDTSAAGSFITAYRAASPSTAFTLTTGVTQWPNDKYDDYSGTLVTMTNNRYACLWFYLETDGDLVMLYGRNQYTTQALAQAEGAPATVPGAITASGRLIGRIIFQKSAVTATVIETVWSSTLSPTSVADHGGLAGLTDLDHPASAIINTPAGDIAATTVQAAIDELDTEKVKIAGQLGGTASSPTVIAITETGGPTALTLGAIVDGEYLKRSGTTVVSAASVAGALDDLTDVNAPAPNNNDVLTWDSTPGEWVAAAPTGGSLALDDLTNVNAPTPNNGDVLSWDSANAWWEPVAAGTPAAHASSHQSGGGDAIKLDDLAAPDDNTDLDVSTAKHGLTPKAPNDTAKFLRGDATWTTIPAAAPAAHAASHKSGGSDPIKLDELAAPDDNTTLDVSITKHGLTPKAPNDTAKYLRGDATWATVSATVAALDDIGDVNAATPNDNDVLTWDTGTSKWIAQAGGGGTLTLSQRFTIFDPVEGSQTYPLFLAAVAGTIINVAASKIGSGTCTVNATINTVDVGTDVTPGTAPDWAETAANDAFVANDEIAVEVNNVDGAISYLVIQVDYTQSS